MRYTYTIICEGPTQGPFTARMVDPENPDAPTPFEAEGMTPILAVAALGKICETWPTEGAMRWFNTPQGKAIMDHFVLGEPLPQRPRGTS